MVQPPSMNPVIWSKEPSLDRPSPYAYSVLKLALHALDLWTSHSGLAPEAEEVWPMLLGTGTGAARARQGLSKDLAAV